MNPATGERRIRVFRTDTGAPPSPVYNVRHPLDKKLYDIQLASGTAPPALPRKAEHGDPEQDPATAGT